MNTVVFSEVKAACLAVSTLSTQLEEIIKEVLGKYYKRTKAKDIKYKKIKFKL